MSNMASFDRYVAKVVGNLLQKELAPLIARIEALEAKATAPTRAKK
ncbi:MAG: hypothetical protein QM698_14205 [Micropepsaceae bacterium]